MARYHSIENGWENWSKIIRLYNQPSALKSWWQIANSVIPYIALWDEQLRRLVSFKEALKTV